MFGFSKSCVSLFIFCSSFHSCFYLKSFEVRPNNWVDLSICFFSFVVKSKTVWEEIYTTFLHITFSCICHCNVMSKHKIKIPSLKKSLVVTEDQIALNRFKIKENFKLLVERSECTRTKQLRTQKRTICSVISEPCVFFWK